MVKSGGVTSPRSSAIRALLDEALPALGLDPRGYRNVRRIVSRRVVRRIRELALAGPDEYAQRLAGDPEERRRLDALCRIPISRLYRDAAVFERLERELLPALAAQAATEGGRVVRVWSAGCASGEEPCSVALAWAARAARDHPELRLAITATDADETMLGRLRRGAFSEGSLAELPPRLRELALEPGTRRARAELLASIDARLQDLRLEAPSGPFDVVLCRNLAFTYFDEAGRRSAAERLVAALAPHGLLVLGRGEFPPAGLAGVEPYGTMVWKRR